MELVINFSGGKDSCAMLAWICENYPDAKKHVVFADTGWEHTDAENWCKSIVSGFGLQLITVRNLNKTFLTMVDKRGMFPGMQTRQCTSDLKRGPIHTWIRRNIKDKLIINCLGIRSEESTSRKRQKKLSRNKSACNSKRTVWDWCPIKDWTEKEIYAYLALKNIPLHPAYKYLKRFSCRVCIYMSKQDVNNVAINDPEAIDIIDHLEIKTGFTMFQSGGIRTLINN